MRICTTLTVPLSCVAVALLAQSALAQEKKEEYVSEAEKHTLVEQALPGADGKIISINHFKLPPGFVGGKHYHSVRPTFTSSMAP